MIPSTVSLSLSLFVFLFSSVKKWQAGLEGADGIGGIRVSLSLSLSLYLSLLLSLSIKQAGLGETGGFGEPGDASVLQHPAFKTSNKNLSRRSLVREQTKRRRRSPGKCIAQPLAWARPGAIRNRTPQLSFAPTHIKRWRSHLHRCNTISVSQP